MVEIDWRKEYKGEFTCPRCNFKGMNLAGTSRGNQNPSIKKRRFFCPNCCGSTMESWEINWVDSEFSINWRNDYKVGEFACPNSDCGARKMHLWGHNRSKKRVLKCAFCNTICSNSIDLKSNIVSNFSGNAPAIKSFNFDDDIWDLRTINNTSLSNKNTRFTVYFNNVKLDWFKSYSKQYIYHQCKKSKPFKSILTKIGSLRIFVNYLSESEISDITQIDRSVILSFLSWDQSTIEAKRQRLGVLKDFFLTGYEQKWFTLDPDIILNSDFPGREIGNPDPISDVVRKQIEENLHKLPEPIARMWIICFFTAMRPVELSLLRKDCLIQEGSHWKLRWSRRKGLDEHEVPITRVISRVVQEQIEYIEQLWGEDWEYLFSHYKGITKDGNDPSFPKLKPVQRVLPENHNPFTLAIRCLIKSNNIRDENGKLATFSSRLVRHTRLTELFAQGHDLALVSAWAGHKSLAVTSTFYTHVSCEQIAEGAGVVQVALFNAEGQTLNYESLPKSFWKNPRAHELNLAGDHINTPIYGSCGLPLDEECAKFRACYTCPCFFATAAKLQLYIKIRDELRTKEAKAKVNGQVVLVEQFGIQADRLDYFIAEIQGESCLKKITKKKE